jgi:hypothetical protein
MNRDDFVKLVGTSPDGKTQHVPVAFLLSNGYACAGHYHPAVNEGLGSTCVLLNARLIELQGERLGGRASLNDFNDFLEEVVADFCESDGEGAGSPRADSYGKSIPLTAIPYDQIVVLYPVAHISTLMRQVGQQQQAGQQQPSRTPSFLDLDKSELLKLMRARLW